MSKQWDKFSAADWTVQECWRQITNNKPQTNAWLPASIVGPDDPPWEIVLEAVDLLVQFQWIEFENYSYSLSHSGPSSVNRIAFTGRALEEIKRQLEENPNSPLKFT
jgi:hypothetical protein